MANIQIPRLPQAAKEYSQTQQNTLIQTLEQLIFLLNNSYTPETLRQEDEQITWFLG
jgi:preprotein translocase subunit Sec63